MPLGLGVQDDTDITLPPKLDRLGLVPPRPAETERVEQRLQFAQLLALGGKFDERGIADGDGARKLR